MSSVTSTAVSGLRRLLGAHDHDVVRQCTCATQAREIDIRAIDLQLRVQVRPLGCQRDSAFAAQHHPPIAPLQHRQSIGLNTDTSRQRAQCNACNRAQSSGRIEVHVLGRTLVVGCYARTAAEQQLVDDQYAIVQIRVERAVFKSKALLDVGNAKSARSNRPRRRRLGGRARNGGLDAA